MEAWRGAQGNRVGEAGLAKAAAARFPWFQWCSRIHQYGSDFVEAHATEQECS